MSRERLKPFPVRTVSPTPPLPAPSSSVFVTPARVQRRVKHYLNALHHTADAARDECNDLAAQLPEQELRQMVPDFDTVGVRDLLAVIGELAFIAAHYYEKQDRILDVIEPLQRAAAKAEESLKGERHVY